MTRVEELRKQEIATLKTQVGLAIKRLKKARITRPEINALNDIYDDGSYRDDVNDTGGTVQPSHHLWAVGRVGYRDVYIYELVDWAVWRANVHGHDLAQLDTGKYELAVSDPSVAMYHNQGTYVGGYDTKALLRVDWPIETIMGITDLVAPFYLPEDLDDRIARTALS